MKHLIKILFLTAFAFYLQAQEASDVNLVVVDGEERIKIGFLGFSPVEGETKVIPVDPGRVISDDLDFSGRIQMVQALNIDSSTLSYFVTNEALAYIHGTYEYKGKKIIIRCYLKDSESQELILGKEYTTTKKGLRQTAHQFSDELIYSLFGEKGIFQTKILFTSKQSGTKEVYQMDYDGANSQRLTKNGSTNLFPCWLKDNTSIVYTSYKGGAPQLYIKNIPVGKERLFTRSKFMNTGSDYNPIDGEIVYTSSVNGNTEVFRVSENGKNKARLTFSRALETSPSWSPNGYEIVFTSNRSGAPMIYIMDRDGANMRRLTYDGGYNTSPSWSPNGDKIVFCSMSPGGNMDIYTISVNGKNLTRLTSGQGSNESPSWSPDGRAIVFSSTRLGRPELYYMWANGSHQKRITNFGKNSSPKWSYF